MERKVRIISISGQPLSGKSTAIDKMKEKLMDEGIDEKDIHVISVGKKFREYFNKIMDLAIELKNKEKEDILVDEELKELCSNQELRNEMKKALINLIISKFDLNNFDIEKANNSPELKEIRDLIDTIVDTKVKELGENAIKENKENEVWIMDSRLAFSNIPESFAVRLTVRDDIAGQRLFDGTRKRGKEDNNYKDVNEAIDKTIKRGQGEEKRYKQRYGIDLSDENNYDLIIDTSFSDVDEIAETILKCEKLRRENKYFEKKWASPKIFLPMQGERDTVFGCGTYTMEEMVNVLKEQGYDPSCGIEVFESNGRYYIYEGHHRNFAMAYLGKTLIPYVKAPIDQKQADARAKSIKIHMLYGHEDYFDIKNPDGTRIMFSYNSVYPNIREELQEKEKALGRWEWD